LPESDAIADRACAGVRSWGSPVPAPAERPLDRRLRHVDQSGVGHAVVAQASRPAFAGDDMHQHVALSVRVAFDQKEGRTGQVGDRPGRWRRR
jgi:hypothetical protein